MGVSPTIIRVVEFGRVELPKRWNTARIRERLQEATLKAGVRAFDIRGRHLHAQGVVGVVDFGAFSVEILPKTHEESTLVEDSLFLSDLLRFGGVVDRRSVIDARTSTGERAFLEIFLSWAAREAAANLREGLPRRYEVREEKSTAVRGRIELKELARRSPGKDFELVIRHAPLSNDNVLSRTIKWLLLTIAHLTRQISTRRMCARLLQDLDDIGASVPEIRDLDRLVLPQIDIRWRPLLDFSRLLMRQVAPNPTRAGSQKGVTVLFTLHDLFERVLRRVFHEGLSHHGITLGRPKRHLLSALPGDEQYISLRPDYFFVGTGGAGLPLVGDAKWKRIFAGVGEVSLAEADAYQIVAYVSTFSASAGFVFCPLLSPPLNGLMTTADFGVNGSNSSLHVTGVHLPTLIAETTAGVATRAALCAHVASRWRARESAA